MMGFREAMESSMRTPLLAARLVRADHVRSFQICPALPAGWEASERDNQRVVQEQRLKDWHRVEQALTRFKRQIVDLRDQGWRDA
jgi:hypothetical protein